LSYGYLKIFLGYASGVGKSFRMLDEARRRHERGQDVVVGAVQPNLPAKAEEILHKLEVVPLLDTGHGTALDVQGIVRRYPDACFVDGLAYNNPLGSRNSTRWQDVKELVQAGIKVIASINIQYITELQAQVQTITGKAVEQTVPISFIKSADEVEIVDAPAVQPMVRTPAEQMSSEERRQQLCRLREMALVLAADVVDHQLSCYLESHGVKQHFGTQERILVCVGSKTDSQQMIETAQVIAHRFHGELIVAHFNEPELSPVDRAVFEQKLDFARSAGARIEVLDGHEPADAILDFAKNNGITQLFIGHSQRPTVWSRMWGTSFNRLIQKSQGMDVRIFPNKK
jgi:two-component system, OmpR family, sensor histidine kinase KdpD